MVGKLELELSNLKELKDKGLIDEEEFKQKKAQLLGLTPLQQDPLLVERITKLEEETNKLKEESNKLKEESNKLKEESNKLKEETKRIPELEEQLAFLNLRGVQSKSHLAVYNYIEKNGGFVQDDTQVFQGISPVDDALVNHKWGLIKNLLPPAHDALEQAYQAVSNQVFDAIIRSDYLILRKNQKLLMPDLIPDLSITSAYDRSLSWRSLLIPVEVETHPNREKEGTGQAISYLSFAMEEAHRKFGFCVFTDCHQVDIVRVNVAKSRKIPNVFHTGPLPFLTSELNPSPGFQLLVRLLQAHPTQLGMNVSIPVVEELNVPAITSVGKLVGYGRDSFVYAANMGTTEVAVKQKRTETLPDLTGEAKVLKELEQNSIPNIPQLLYSNPRVLVMKPLGKSLQQHIADSGPMDSAQAAILMRQLITSLSRTHMLGWTHRDIRPSNIILFEDQALIIDWGLASKSKSLIFAVGTLAYSASKLLRASMNSNPVTYQYSFDFESLAYTLLFMLCGSLPWNKAQGEKSILDARKRIESQVVIDLLNIISNMNVNNYQQQVQEMLQSLS